MTYYVSGEVNAYLFIASTAASLTTLLSHCASKRSGSKIKWTDPSPINGGSYSSFYIKISKTSSSSSQHSQRKGINSVFERFGPMAFAIFSSYDIDFYRSDTSSCFNPSIKIATEIISSLLWLIFRLRGGCMTQTI